MKQHGILRFKAGGNRHHPIEAHNERTKEQYASNPDIDTNRSHNSICSSRRQVLKLFSTA